VRVRVQRHGEERGDGEDDGDGDGDLAAARCVARAGWDVKTAIGSDTAAILLAAALGEGRGSAAGEGWGAAELGLAVSDAAGGAAAAGWPPPSVRESATPVPVRATTAAATATPERKLISSMRAFITRLSVRAQPVPSLTTKHDTGISGNLLGSR
jgi:hypothetical protein